MNRLAILAAVLWLTGCASPPPVSTNAVCPIPKAYSKADEATVAGEMKAAPADAEWPGWISDYIAERDALKACRK